MKHNIILWDDCPQRINEMEPRLRTALARMGMEAEVRIHNERPLLSRNRLQGNTPAFQLDNGDFWRLRSGESVTVDEFKNLLITWRRLNLL